MTWFYANQGEATGPVSEEELLSRFRSGALAPTTLVWREGMAAWQAASVVLPHAFAVQTTPQPVSPLAAHVVAPPSPTASGEPPVLPQFFCTVCGTVIPADQLVRISERAVCAACKPSYVQHVQEGVPASVRAPIVAGLPGALPAARRFAGFWIRGLALFLDILILMLVSGLLHVVTGGSWAEAFGMDDDPPRGIIGTAATWTSRDIVLFLVELILDTAYETILVAKYGGTLGKLACGLRVITAEGGRLSYRLSLYRTLAKWLSLLPCGAGFIMAAFDREKRGLHDLICQTRVTWRNT